MAPSSLGVQSMSAPDSLDALAGLDDFDGLAGLELDGWDAVDLLAVEDDLRAVNQAGVRLVVISVAGSGAARLAAPIVWDRHRSTPF